MKRLMAMAALALALAIALLAADAPGGLAASRLAQQGTVTGTEAATAVATAPTTGAPAPTVDYRASDTLAGAMLGQHYTCLSCHSMDGNAGLGPTFKGLYGSTVTLSDGSTVVADHAYLITSIVSPGAQVVQGYPTWLMPNFSPYMRSLDLLQIVTVIESMGTPPPTVQPGTPSAAVAATVAPAASPTAAATMPLATIALVTRTPVATGTGLAVPTNAAPEIQVTDQAAIAGTIMVTRVVSRQGGWIVIQADSDGAPGAILGRAYVSRGLTYNLAVAISTRNLTPTLHAVLYADAGAERVFESSGADTPVQVAGSPVEATFKVTGASPAATTAAAATPGATPASTGTAISG